MGDTGSQRHDDQQYYHHHTVSRNQRVPASDEKPTNSQIEFSSQARAGIDRLAESIQNQAYNNIKVNVHENPKPPARASAWQAVESADTADPVGIQASTGRHKDFLEGLPEAPEFNWVPSADDWLISGARGFGILLAETAPNDARAVGRGLRCAGHFLNPFQDPKTSDCFKAA